MRLEGLKDWGSRDRAENLRRTEPKAQAETRLMIVIQTVMLLAATLIIVALSGDFFARLTKRARGMAVEVRSFQSETQKSRILNGEFPGSATYRRR